MKTLAIIPAKDEEAALPSTLDELRRCCPELDVLVVDDGSSDATAALAAAHGATVVSLPFNLGIGGALRTGFRFAVEHGYDRAIQFDADGQHDPTSVVDLLAALDRGADMVIGSRFADATIRYDVGPLRRRAMGLLRLTVRLLSGTRYTDTSSGFRAFNRPVLEYFARTYPVEYMESVESLLLACYAGFQVVEVPARMHSRAAGTASTRRLRLLYHYLRLLVVLITSAPGRRRARPLEVRS